MSEDVLADDQSHYEISLTAGQAFVAFVLLLLSLAASFAFGLMIGKGQGDDRLVVRKEPAVVGEASVLPKKNAGTIVELGVGDSDFKPKPQPASASAADSTAPSTEMPSTEMPAAATASVVEATPAPVTAPVTKPVETPKATPAPAPASVRPAPATTAAPATNAAPVPHYAQLLSTADKNTAETLAAKLIDHGFTSAYVERGTSGKGPMYRVRVRFPSEPEARAAEPKLREFSKEVWITR
jgi:cell division septation protein DedD